jgi:putative phosphonate metabolism protein
MKSNPRYAIYYAPRPDTAFARFGASVLGYDAHSGNRVPFLPALTRSFPTWSHIAAEPARYGFHATLKAPFELGRENEEAELLNAVRTQANRMRSLVIGELEVAAMGSFVALVPLDQTELREIAGEIVSGLDHLRAPLTEADRQRRLKSPLTERQKSYLEQWGYPFVFDEFRFHMTLTGSLADPTHRTAAHEVLRQLFAVVCEPVVLDALTVFRQQERKGAFTPIARFELTAS